MAQQAAGDAREAAPPQSELLTVRDDQQAERTQSALSDTVSSASDCILHPFTWLAENISASIHPSPLSCLL